MQNLARRRFFQTFALAQSNQQEYVVRDKLRYVRPYVYQFEAFAKERWFNKPLLKIYSEGKKN